MNYSLLNEISNFSKNNNISIKQVYYKIDNFFPDAFKKTIINLFQTLNVEKAEENPEFDGFYINIDNDNNTFFEFVSKKGTRIVIIQDFTFYKNLPPAIKIKESEFLKRFTYFDKENYLKILESLPYDFKKRFLSEINYEKSVEDSLSNIKRLITAYIEYIQSEKDLISKNETENIFYVEAEKSTNVTNQTKENKSTKSRKHDELDITKRNDIIDNYKPERKFRATASNTGSTYYVKVFRVKDKYKLIMEPKEGTKYTKIVHLDVRNITKRDIKKIVIDSLELSRSEITEKDNITRHTHTTIEEYKKLIEYLLNENDTGLTKSTKDRIDEASKKR